MSNSCLETISRDRTVRTEFNSEDEVDISPSFKVDSDDQKLPTNDARTLSTRCQIDFEGSIRSQSYV